MTVFLCPSRRLNWAPVSAWYANLPLADTGLILAEWPWSGYYSVGSSVWAYAHTSQFAQPGWKYINSACGYLPNGAIYVTLKAPSAAQACLDFSTIIETMDARAPATVEFDIGGGLSAGPIHLWTSDLVSATPEDDFIQSQIHPSTSR